MLGFFLGLAAALVTGLTAQAHKAAKERMDVLFVLFSDALRTANQLQRFIPRMMAVVKQLDASGAPNRSQLPAYLAIENSEIPIAWVQALAPGETTTALRYISRWNRVKELLARYEKGFARLFLEARTTTSDDVAEFRSTIENIILNATELEVLALRLCRTWLEASYTFAGREPDPERDSEGRWLSADTIQQDIEESARRLAEFTSPPALTSAS